MSEPTLSKEMALRIGLAARAVPDMDASTMLALLDKAVGLPPTAASLAKLTVKSFRAAAENGELNNISGDALKLALAFLRGEGQVTLDTGPEPMSYAEGDMPDSIRVAVASNSGEALDGHFGTCARFLIYQVNRDEFRLIDKRDASGGDDVEDKNAYRADLIDDCHVLYVVSIGGPAAAKVVRRDIHPIKLPDGGPASAAVKRMQEVLAGSPPPWLSKVMGVAAEDRARFRFSEEEGDDDAV